MRKISTLLLAALGLSSVFAVREADEVKSLPDIGYLPSKWYSGYLNVSDTKALFYVFVESQNTTTQKDDPVIVWFNGGPGCSSLLALFSENGPFVIDDGETIIKPNPYPWTERNNVLYIESPAGVGFTYFASDEDKAHNDMTQSEDAFKALSVFF